MQFGWYILYGPPSADVNLPHRTTVIYSPPARWWSLDFNKGASAPYLFPVGINGTRSQSKCQLKSSNLQISLGTHPMERSGPEPYGELQLSEGTRGPIASSSSVHARRAPPQSGHARTRILRRAPDPSGHTRTRTHARKRRQTGCQNSWGDHWKEVFSPPARWGLSL